MEAVREALIVATDTFGDPKLRSLRAPARDAEELARVLGDSKIGEFEVKVSLNEPDHVVRRRLSEFFRDRGREDLLLLHVSSHGLKDEDGTLYFATTNTEVDHLEATAIPSEFVNRQMTRSRSARIVLLLDCCFGGAFARGFVHRGGEGVDVAEKFDGRGRVVLTASRAMEWAFEGDQLQGEARPSVFTSAIVDGLQTGRADRDQDSRISVDELYDHVYDHVRGVTPNQTPSKWTFDVQGDLYVAKSSYRAAVEPAELPLELRAAIESPLANLRAGGVEELARLLRGGHPGLQLAARTALNQLVADDSRRVSEAAAQTLRLEPGLPLRAPPVPDFAPAEEPDGAQLVPDFAPAEEPEGAPPVSDLAPAKEERAGEEERLRAAEELHLKDEAAEADALEAEQRKPQARRLWRPSRKVIAIAAVLTLLLAGGIAAVTIGGHGGGGSTDTTKPRAIASYNDIRAANGDINLTIQFSEELEGLGVPASAFSAKLNGVPVTVKSVVGGNGSRAYLRIDPNRTSGPGYDGDVLNVTYEPPGSEALRDPSGNLVGSFKLNHTIREI